MGADTQELKGFDDLAQKLRAIVPALRKKALRSALGKAATVIRNDARANAPVLQKSVPYRTPGLLRKSIVVRTSKDARKAGDVGVFVNVRPAKGARFKTVRSPILRVKSRVQVRASQRGAKSKLDPFYWKFQEFGTKFIQGRRFLTNSAKKFPESLRIFQVAIGEWFDKTNKSGKVLP